MTKAKKKLIILIILIIATATAVMAGKHYAKAEEVKVPNDLYAAEISLSPAEPTADEECIINVKIKNNGSKNLFTSAGLSTYSYEFSNFVQTDYSATFPSLANIIKPGEYIYYTFAGYFTGAKADLSFSVDTANELAEENEKNNTVTRQTTVHSAGEADLTISEIKTESDAFVVNTYSTIRLKIKNSGKTYLTSGKGFTQDDIKFSLPGFNIASTSSDSLPGTASPLAPGKEFTYNYGGNFTKIGRQTFSFSLDGENRLAETDENNNASSTEILVALTQEEADDFSILDIETRLISSSSVQIMWETDRKTTGRLVYRKDEYSSKEYELASAAAKTKHELSPNGLEPGVTYKYTVYAVNNAAKKNTGPDGSFTMPKDNTLTISGEPSVTVSNNSAAVNWSTNLSSSGYVFYKLAGGAEKSTGSSAYVWDHKTALSGLEPGDYNFYVISTSTVNTVARSSTINFIISPAATDKNAPAAAPDSGNQNNNTQATTTEVSVDKPAPQSEPAEKETASKEIPVTNNKLYQNLRGKITLKVEDSGKAYYINPAKKTMHYLGFPADAFNVMRGQGVGITNANLNKIPPGLKNLSGADSDGDGLPDIFEDAIGTNKNRSDTDGDGYNDNIELQNNYSPVEKSAKLNLDAAFTGEQAGKIFLQVENKGEAWYVNPADNRRYFLGRPADAFNVMRVLGLGISNEDFNSL